MKAIKIRKSEYWCPIKKAVNRKRWLAVRTFKCTKGCTRSFASNSALKYHEGSAHAEEIYLCPWILCLKSANTLEELSAHLVKGHASYTKLQALNSLTYSPIAGRSP